MSRIVKWIAAGGTMDLPFSHAHYFPLLSVTTSYGERNTTPYYRVYSVYTSILYMDDLIKHDIPNGQFLTFGLSCSLGRFKLWAA